MRSFINLWHAMGIYRPMVKKWDRKLKKSILCKSNICSLMALELLPNGSWRPVVEGSHKERAREPLENRMKMGANIYLWKKGAIREQLRTH